MFLSQMPQVYSPYPFMLHLSWSFGCQECAAVVQTSEVFVSPHGLLPLLPKIPEGWRRVDNAYICPAHEVTIT